jgi:hypothetical protein
MFVKASKTIILMNKGHQHDSAKETKKKIQGFSGKFLLRGLVHQNRGNWYRFMLIKVEIHTLSNDFWGNLS